MKTLKIKYNESAKVSRTSNETVIYMKSSFWKRVATGIRIEFVMCPRC
jgi:hypothetical protein